MMRKPIRLLAIGNSFSDDAFYYLHDLAAADGVELTAVNLYIGGCNLETHWNNACTDDSAYLYMLNGVSTGRYVSIRQALEEGNWDYIMTQQASHDSGLEETYFPYLSLLTDYVRRYCPDTQLLLHETWAYELDSEHSAFSRYHCDQTEMYRMLSDCYHHASAKLNLPLIPSGEVIQQLREIHPFRYARGERSLCRDGYHMDLVYGRYLVAAVVYAFLTGRDIRGNNFVPPNGKSEVLDVIKNCITMILQQTNEVDA